MKMIYDRKDTCMDVYRRKKICVYLPNDEQMARIERQVKDVWFETENQFMARKIRCIMRGWPVMNPA